MNHRLPCKAYHWAGTGEKGVNRISSRLSGLKLRIVICRWDPPPQHDCRRSSRTLVSLPYLARHSAPRRPNPLQNPAICGVCACCQPLALPPAVFHGPGTCRQSNTPQRFFVTQNLLLKTDVDRGTKVEAALKTVLEIATRGTCCRCYSSAWF